MRLFFSIISCVLFLFPGCKNTSTINPDDTTVIDSTFTDIRDNRKYTIVKIGKQVWMSENLQTSTYRNGDSVRYARTNEEWVDAADNREGAWCYYDNDEQNGKTYGKLYNWYAVNDSRGLAPKGYHIPSDEEWTVLTDYLGGEKIAGFKMKSTTGWQNNGNGDNSSGFNGLPGGDRNEDGTFNDVGKEGGWWSSTEYDTNSAWFRVLGYGSGDVLRYDNEKEEGLSVRCLRD
jgi:uncharacterized protein (TIGR02145 family)